MPVQEEAQTETAGRPYYTLPAEQVLSILDTGPAGLNASQARELLEKHGPNELAPPKKISPWVIFFRQFQNLLIIILIAATGISFFLGEHLDAYVILVIILACTVLGFVQEYRAEQAAAALQKMAAPEATVLRDGQEQVIPAREVVPGDVLVLHSGDRVAADGRLVEAVNPANPLGQSLHRRAAGLGPGRRPHLMIKVGHEKGTARRTGANRNGWQGKSSPAGWREGNEWSSLFAGFGSGPHLLFFPQAG